MKAIIIDKKLKDEAVLAIRNSRGNKAVEKDLRCAAEIVKKPVYLPLARHLSDVFETVVPTVLEKGHVIGGHDLIGQVSNRLWFQHNPFLVTFRKGFLESLIESLQLISITGESLYWSVVLRGTTALVVLRYNHIIGDRWVAIVRADTLPECLFKEEEEDES